MTKKKNCADCGACGNVDGKVTAHVSCADGRQCGEKETLDYGFYSNVLKKPFEKLEDLRRMEEAYFMEQKAKEDKAAQKKADAQKVEDAFKALNAARKAYKEDLTQLTKEYAEALEKLKKTFELGKKDMQEILAHAEDVYQAALKEFTDKYDTYHLSLRDGDFETTISGQKTAENSGEKSAAAYNSIYEMLSDIFNW